MSSDTESAIRLPATSRALLVLEQRIPAGYSASEAEHRWHAYPHVKPVDVTASTAAQAFEHADVLRAAAPDRRDTEYRVVLVNTETSGWVLR